jgi:hypothetical protein
VSLYSHFFSSINFTGSGAGRIRNKAVEVHECFTCLVPDQPLYYEHTVPLTSGILKTLYQSLRGRLKHATQLSVVCVVTDEAHTMNIASWILLHMNWEPKRKIVSLGCYAVWLL